MRESIKNSSKKIPPVNGEDFKSISAESKKDDLITLR